MTNVKVLNKGVEVIGFFIHEDHVDNMNGSTVFVAIESGLRNNRIEYYSPIGQHSEGDRDYLNECHAITKEMYLEHNSGAYTPQEYLEDVNIIGTVEHFTLEILQRYESLELLCEALDSCYDLYDLGVIDSELMQECYNYLAETHAVNLWAVYRYANYQDPNYEYTFEVFVKEIKEGWGKK